MAGMTHDCPVQFFRIVEILCPITGIALNRTIETQNGESASRQNKIGCLQLLDRHPGLDPGSIEQQQTLENWPSENGPRLKAGVTICFVGWRSSCAKRLNRAAMDLSKASSSFGIIRFALRGWPGQAGP